MKRLLIRMSLPVMLLLGECRPSVAQVPAFRGTSTPAAFDIRRTRPQQSPRNDYALFIANSTYDDRRFIPLPNCSFDAEELEKLLKTKFGFSTEVRKDVTYSDFESKLGEYVNRTWNENDQLLIYIAGHGGFKPAIKQGFLVMKDSDKVKQSQCFSLPSLQSILRSISCKHILLVLDVCYGGTIDEAIAMEGDVLRGDPLIDSSPALNGSRQTEYVLKKLKPKTRLYVASGGKEPVKEGLKGEHSPFAKALLAKLNETATESGRIVTAYQLPASLEKDVPTVRMGAFDGNQSNSDFLFISKATR